jgi:pyridoxal biosynthesis lyase PdxS
MLHDLSILVFAERGRGRPRDADALWSLRVDGVTVGRG